MLGWSSRAVGFAFATILAVALFPALAFAQDAYVPNSDDGDVSVINTTTQSVIGTITVGSIPACAAVSSDGTRTYIANENSETVSVINTSSNSVIATVPVGNYPCGMAVTPNGALLYVTNAVDGTLSVINTSTNTVITTITLPNGSSSDPLGLAASLDNSTIYVSGSDGHDASVIWLVSTATNTVVGSIPSIYAINDLAISPDGQTLYSDGGDFTTFDNYLLVFDLTNDTLSDAVLLSDVGDGTCSGIALSGDGTTAYLPCNIGGGGTGAQNFVVVYDTPSGSSTTIDLGGSYPDGLSLTHDGTALYVTSGPTDSVLVISTSDDSLVATIPVGSYPLGFGTFIQPPVPFVPQNGELLGPNGCGCINGTGAIAVGEPIDTASGNVAYQVTDYTTVGQNPLVFGRYYNSRGNAPNLTTFAGSLGVNWRSTYDRYIQINSASQVTAERANGQQFVFNLVGSTWTPNSDVDISLIHSGSTWTLTDHNDTVETYTTTTAGNEAQLNTIVARNGYKQTLHYNTSNQLTGVLDTYSRALHLTYNTSGTLNTVTTPDSSTLTFGYNSVTGGNQLTSVSYSTTPASEVQYQYTQSGLPFALTAIIDEDGNTYATWTYDAFARGLSSQLGAGANLTQVAYNGDGTTTVTNAFGVNDTYSFDNSYAIPKASEISRAATSTTAAATESFGYDSNGYLSSVTDWDGNQTTYVNDMHGDPLTINEAVGSAVARTTTILYDGTFVHLPDTITTPSVTIGYAYDPHGNPKTKTLTDTTTQSVPYTTNGETEVWNYTWNNALLASVETPNLNTTNYQYSATGALTQIANALTQDTNITAYSGGGYPQTIVDPNSVTTTLTYDARQRLTTSTVHTSAGLLTTTYTIDPTGELSKLTLPDSSYLAYGYDTAHRLTQITDTLGNYIKYTLDALGDRTASNIYNSSSTLERQHSATFDALGRILTDVGGESQTTTYGYDPNGNILTIIDPLSNQTTRTFDALNRLSTSLDANHGTAQFTYDAHDRPLTVEDQNSHTTSYVYDGFGNAIQQASPDSGTAIYYYDSDNNLKEKSDALSIVTNQTFDALDRVLTTTYPSATTLNVGYTYDQTGTGFGFGIGHLTSVTDAAGSLTRSYDERGNMLQEQRVGGGTTLTTVYTYDPASRIGTITYPDGALITNQYNTAGYLNLVKAKPSGSSSTINLATPAHLPFGPINSVTYANGISESWTFDLDYRADNITDSVSGTTLQNLTYGYDADNNVKTITDAVHASNGQTLGYDVLNRLKTAVSGTGGYGSLGWTYDKVGNVKNSLANGVSTTYQYTSGTNRLSHIITGSTNISVSTNANGNITSIPPANGTTNATFSYSAANRLASVSGSPVAASFVYDAFGRRFSKTDTGASAILYVYAQDGNLLEENNGGTITDYVYADRRPVGALEPGASPTANRVNIIVADRLGTPQLASNISASTTWGTTYQPYGTTGTVTGSVTQNVRFPGQYADAAETGFNYNLNRDYMPNIGRYLETDPGGIIGGFGTYGYAMQNPIKTTDPWGLFTIVIVNNNGFGHSGMYVSNSGSGTPLIYDPYGSYDPHSHAPSTVNNDIVDTLYPPRGSDGTIQGDNLDWANYVQYQMADGPDVQTYIFNTTPAEEQQLAQEAEQLGEQGLWNPLNSCTTKVSTVLSSTGPFTNFGTFIFPGQLGSALATLQSQATYNGGVVGGDIIQPLPSR